MYCYIINYPKMWLVKITNMYYPRACVCQESGCHSAGCLWLTASNKVTVKSLAEAAVTWRVVWGWSICFQEGSLLVGVGCQSLTGYCQEASSLHAPLHRSAWMSWHSSWLTPEWARRKPKYLISESWKSSTVFCHILRVRNNLVSPLEGRNRKRICEHIVKLPQMPWTF